MLRKPAIVLAAAAAALSFGLASTASAAVTHPQAHSVVRPHDAPSGGVQFAQVNSDHSLEIGDSGGYARSTTSGVALQAVGFGDAGSGTYALQEYGTNSCLWYDASESPYFHFAQCNLSTSTNDFFYSPSSNSYSEQVNVGTQNCFYSDGNGGKLEDEGCSGTNQADRWTYVNT